LAERRCSILGCRILVNILRVILCWLKLTNLLFKGLILWTCNETWNVRYENLFPQALDANSWHSPDVTLYQGELEAGTGTVTISAGGTANVDLESSLDVPDTIWSIGTVDGTPAGVSLAVIQYLVVSRLIYAPSSWTQTSLNICIRMLRLCTVLLGLKLLHWLVQIRFENGQLGSSHLYYRSRRRICFPHGTILSCESISSDIHVLYASSAHVDNTGQQPNYDRLDGYFWSDWQVFLLIAAVYTHHSFIKLQAQGHSVSEQPRHLLEVDLR